MQNAQNRTLAQGTGFTGTAPLRLRRAALFAQLRVVRSRGLFLVDAVCLRREYSEQDGITVYMKLQ